MSDFGTKYADKVYRQVVRKLKAIYTKAQQDINHSIDMYLDNFKKRSAELQKLIDAGELALEAYQEWLRMQVLQGDIWGEKLRDVTGLLADANRQALNIINDRKMDVFAQNANYAAFQIEKGTSMAYSFSLYDRDAVWNLIKNNPELLPLKTLNQKKDAAWNMKALRNCITQGIIQGDSVPDLAQRIANGIGSMDMKAMVRTARTAMTSAQNAGRMQTLHRAQEMGIAVKKRWLSAHDDRVRDSHIDLDGQVAEVDQPFDSILGPIMFPGDPTADPANTYNCRCTLTYIYPGHNGGGSRMTYDQWVEAKDNKERGW